MSIWSATMKIVTILIALGLLLVIIGVVVIQLSTNLAHVLLGKPFHQSA